MEGFCRGCLIKYNEPMELLQYTEKTRRLFVYSTGLQVKRNDTFTFQLCKDCFLNMKQACKFKKLCRTSDKRLKSYTALKNVGDPVDFCTFLKNNDDTLTFRLPMTSGNSTPAAQKCKDDDNESTCTSIPNFMTDILQGEEIPETEARIIREVIEEEADVLEDSLDSHWMQDDMSIDTDFRLDFSFSPFSTPHSVNNDHCYTPKQTQEQVTFDTLNSEKQTKILNDFTNAFKTNENIMEHNVFGGEVSGIEKTDNLKNLNELNPFGMEIDVMDTTDVKTDKRKQNLRELCDFGIDEINELEKSDSNLDLPSLPSDVYERDKMSTPDFAIPKGVIDSIEDIDSIHKTESNTNENNRNLKELYNFGIDEIDRIGNSKSNQSLNKITSNVHVEEIDVTGKSITNNTNSNQDLKQLFDFSLDRIGGKKKAENKNKKNVSSLKELCDFSLDSFEDTTKSESKTFRTDRNVKDICDFGIDEINLFEKSESNLDLPSLASDVFERDKIGTPDFDIPKGVIGSIQFSNDISNGSINIEALLKDKSCTININSEEALKNNDEQKISLDDLLVSPSVFPSTSAASTPTITKILFGEKLDTPDSNTNIGQCTEPYHDVQGDIEIFEEFFQNDTKEFYVEDIKRENEGFKPEYWKNLTADDEVDNKEKESKNIDMDISIDDKDEVDNVNDTAVIKSEKEPVTHFSDKSTDDKFDIENSYCKLCNKKYDTGRALSVHFSKTHNIKIIKPKKSKNTRMYNKNDTAVTESNSEAVIIISDTSLNEDFDIENGWSCKFCNKSYKTRRSLSIHFSNVHNIRFVKPECDRKTSQNDQICNHCGEISKDSKNFARHVKICQPNKVEEKVFKCDRCLAEFTTLYGLEKHKICHTQIKKIKKSPKKEYVCTFCGVIIYKQSNLLLHMRRHTKDYSAKCDICDKGFYRQTDLKVHMRKHTGETPFACKFCPRLFARRDVLTRHVLAHLGEKLFQCDYCNKKHMKKCDLIKHIQNQSCRIKRTSTSKKKMDKDKQEVTVMHAKGSNEAIKKLCRTKRKLTHKEKMDIDIPIKKQKKKEENKEVEKEVVTVIYAKGSDAAIKKQLPFLETERSN